MTGRIFVSYSHRDHARVSELVEALKAIGIQVWWDTDLPVGADWDERIQRALEQAAAVFVVWSEASMISREVRAEATYGMNEAKLLPVRIENVRVWARYAIVKYHDLFGRPVNADPNWVRVVESVRQRHGAMPASGELATDAAPRLLPEVARGQAQAGSAPAPRDDVVIPREAWLPAALVIIGLAVFLGWAWRGGAIESPWFGAACALTFLAVVTALSPLFAGVFASRGSILAGRTRSD